MDEKSSSDGASPPAREAASSFDKRSRAGRARAQGSFRAARTPTPRATTSIPRHRRRSSCAARAATSGTSTATSSSSTAWACARYARPCLRAGGRGGRARSCDGHELHAAGAVELECAETFLRIVPAAEMVKFAKTARTSRRRGQAGARLHGRDLVAICARPAVLLDRRLVHRHDRHARGHPGAVRAAHASDSATTTSTSSRRCSTQHPGQIACVVLEAATHRGAARRFLTR